MKKYLSIVLSFAMSLSLCACSQSTNSQMEEADDISVEEVIEPISEVIIEEPTNPMLDTYIEIFNNFELRDEEISKVYDGEYNAESILYQDVTWNDPENGMKLFTTSATYEDNTFYYGIGVNEDYSRKAILWIIFDNYDPDTMKEFITGLDFHEETEWVQETENGIYCPSGIVYTWDGVVGVNSEDDYYIATQNESSNPRVQFNNYAALSYLYGISFDNFLNNEEYIDIASLWHIDELIYVYASYYGVRGYDSYLNTNGFGVIINDLVDLQSAVEIMEEDGPLSEVYYLATYGGSEPQYTDDSEDYSDWYMPDYDFNHDPESMSDFVQGAAAISDFLYGNFWNLLDVASGTYGN